MPKRKRTSSNDIQVLGEKEIKKIQRLITESNLDDEAEEVDRGPKKLVILDDCTADDLDFKDVLYADEQEVNMASNEEWNKFFGTTAEEDFQTKLLQCKHLVEDEISEYCGDLLEGVDSFQEELPEELRKHMNLLKSVLRSYRSGPLPKTVKVLPALPGWDGLLEMLDPLSWTRQAHMKISKVFASKGHEPSLHYYENYLLPKVQQDIASNRRLSVHLFEALINSMFRPQEFVAGIFLPWVRSEMSKTEATVLAHLLRKASLKVRFGTVCLALVCKEPFSIARSLVVESLLLKKYNMPEAAVAVLVDYFCAMDGGHDVRSQFFTDEGRLPLSFFRSLCVFLELYRDAVVPGERERLVQLCRRHSHPFFTQQIRAYLQIISTQSKI